jgi:hypothetical protein
MGSVTNGAVALDHSVMGTASFLWKHILVAIVTKLLRVSDQQVFVRRRMGNMAAGTVPFFKEWVDISPLENFLKVLMTFDAGGPPGSRPKLEGVCRVGRCCGQDKKT